MGRRNGPSDKGSAALLQLRRTPSQCKVFRRDIYTVISGESDMLSLIGVSAALLIPRRFSFRRLTTGENERPTRARQQILFLDNFT
jgi:hypothetical protein